MAIVVDASVSLRWLLKDSLSEACWRLFERISRSGDRITVPTLWLYEMVSGLSKAASFGSITREEAAQLVEQVYRLDPDIVTPDFTASQWAFEWTLRLNRFSAYDCFYLVLAETLACELWTADRNLFNATRNAKLEWVHWIEAV